MTRPGFAALLVLTLGLAGPVRAVEPPAPVAVPDTITTGHRRALEWGLAGAALLGSVAIDHSARDELYLDSHGRYGAEARALQRFAQPEVIAPVILGMAGTGLLTHDPDLYNGAWEGVVALGVTGLATTALKVGIGRERPNHGGDPDEFHPGSHDGGYHSFPSGHSAAAFSLATILSESAHRRWVSVASYGFATGVAWARVQGDHHWVSDVVGGAILGTVTTRATLHWLDGRLGRKDGVALDVSPLGFDIRIPTP